MALPAGTATLLFSDIEGSTRLLEQLGERYADVLDEHRRIVRGAIAEHGGHEIRTEGDAFFVAFLRREFGNRRDIGVTISSLGADVRDAFERLSETDGLARVAELEATTAPG